MARPHNQGEGTDQGQSSPSLAPKVYSQYFSWVREAEKPNLIKGWGVVALISAVAIVVATLVPFGGNWAKAIIAFPAAIGVYAISYGALERAAAKGDKPHPKDVYSPRRRRTMGLVAVAVLLVVSFTLSNYVPYALGGALIAGASLFVYDFIRLTPGEAEVQKAGLVDVRELAEAGIDTEDLEPEDVDWSWDEDEMPADQEVTGEWDDMMVDEERDDHLPRRKKR